MRHRSAGAPEASRRMDSCRDRSLLFSPSTDTIRLEYVRPRWTIAAVDRPFSAILCAVPAFSLVEPPIASGPVSVST